MAMKECKVHTSLKLSVLKLERESPVDIQIRSYQLLSLARQDFSGFCPTCACGQNEATKLAEPGRIWWGTNVYKVNALLDRQKQ